MQNRKQSFRLLRQAEALYELLLWILLESMVSNLFEALLIYHFNRYLFEITCHLVIQSCDDKIYI